MYLKIEILPEMRQQPVMHSKPCLLFTNELRLRLDDYLTKRQSIDFLSDLPTILQTSTNPGSKYNSSMISTIVMYVGVQAIHSIHSKNQRISMASIAHTPFMDIYQNLTVSLCTEGTGLFNLNKTLKVNIFN